MADMADIPAEPFDVAAPPLDAPPSNEWRTHSRNRREFTTMQGHHGLIYREGKETVEEARRRTAGEPVTEPPSGERLPPKAGPAEKSAARPKPRKPKRPPMPDAPRGVDLKELEATLAEAFKSPAILCATFGDEWAAEHFTKSGPYLARNLIVASEHNPWLRQRLEEAATGQDAMMKIVTLVGVGGAAVAYIVPPVIYWLNLPVPDKTRQMFGIPKRLERQPDYAATQANGQPGQPAEPAPAAQPDTPAAPY